MSESTRIQKIIISSIKALIEALEAKDPYTAGHSRRVTEVSLEISKQLSLSRAETAQVRLGAMLHDIGKIGVREAVLNKEGALTDAEYEHVMQHMLIGKRILDPIFSGSGLLDVVAYHHERYDGTGLPEGRRGMGIPLAARIIALADAVDAMGSQRSYRAGMSPAEIAQQVEKGSGTQFDPRIVEAFFETSFGKELAEASAEAPQEGSPAPQEPQESQEPQEPQEDQPDDEPVDDGLISVVVRDHHGEEEEDGEVEERVVQLSPSEPPPEPLHQYAQVVKAVKALKDIRALPFVTAEILNLTSTTNGDIDNLIHAILRDPALVAKILKLSNTSYYASRERVQTVERAVVNIGFSGIREIALGVAVVNLFDKKTCSGSLNRLQLWRHQLATAVIARDIAARGEVAPPEDAFVAALLHDLGMSIIDDLYPEEYAVCTRYAASVGVPLKQAEQAYLGADHTQVGAEIARTWNLAEKFHLAMEFHHETWENLSRMRRPGIGTVMVAKVSEILARARNVGSDADPLLEDIPRSVFSTLNVKKADVDEIMETFPEKMTELEMIFLMNTSRDDGDLDDPEPPAELAGRRALFIAPNERPADPVFEYLSAINLKTWNAPSVRKGVDSDIPDLVFVRSVSEKVLETALKELGELSEKGTVNNPKVCILGNHNGNGKLASLYPANSTFTLPEPFSIPNLTRKLALFFSE